MVPIVTVLYAVGLLIIPGILAAACGWVEPRWARASAGLEGSDLQFHACPGAGRLQLCGSHTSRTTWWRDGAR